MPFDFWKKSSKQRERVRRAKNASVAGDLRRSLRVESLEERRVFTAVPYGANALDTGEFLLGDVSVTPVFLESNGTFDASTEDWNELSKQSVLANIDEGLQWWEDTLDNLNTVHDLNFSVDTTFADTPFETRYEGISRRSNDYALYVREFLDAQGYTTGNLEIDMRNFNHDQRLAHNTQWAFTMIIVPSFNDADGQFAAGGSFRRAFAFAGGLFMVVPSTRPASTIAHELGHIFWARDEYLGGGNYFQRRGYYNTQNTNAADNPDPNFEQQPSIMAAGTLLQDAYVNNVSPASTLAQLGWQDSDNDGIFDVLDVPHRLNGTGFYDTTSSTYRFQGSAAVQTLPNLNPSGLGNDITINRIREIEYRFDGGAWQTALTPDAYEVDLDLSINVPDGAQEIEIRARDSSTTVTSNVFLGRVVRADATPLPGINGFAWIDQNNNNLRDLGEYGQEFWTVELVDGSGTPLDLRTVIEPDDLPDGQLTSGFSQDVSLRAIGSATDGRVGVFNDTTPSTGSKVFRGFSSQTSSYLSGWTDSSRRLQADFNQPTSIVEIDAIGTGNNTYGRLEAYNTQGQLLGRYTTQALGTGEVETMRIARGVEDIAYVIAGGHGNTSVKLDFLRFGPETTTLTGAQGQYAFHSLPAGSYNVRLTPNNGFVAIDPAGGQQVASVAANEAVIDVDFGFGTTSSDWQNPNNQFDVNADTIVTAIDVLLIINDINQNGARDLTGSSTSTPPYIDASGDSFVSALDVLLVINHVNNNSGNGEGESVPALEWGEDDEEERDFFFGQFA
ncbi:MAG: dockerin type I domain-containing protein [Planctomycetota bacterium]